MSSRLRLAVLAVCCLAATAAALAGHLVLGRAGMPVGDAIDTLLGHPHSPAQELIVELRLPRALVGIVAGVALACAGFLLQSVTDNPLAEPGLLGISSGAALGVVTADALGVGSTELAAGIGGLSAVGLIAAATYGHWRNATQVTLAGVLVGAALTAAVGGVLAVTGGPVADVLRWLVGSLNGRTETDLPPLLALTAVGLLLAGTQLRGLGVLRLSAPVATALGARPTRTRLVALAAAVVLTTGAVLAAGAVAFVGLAAPHLARGATRSTRPGVLLLGSALVGAALLPLADLLAMRTTVTLPWGDSTVTGLPVGAVVAPLAAPYLIVILRRQKGRTGA